MNPRQRAQDDAIAQSPARHFHAQGWNVIATVSSRCAISSGDLVAAILALVASVALFRRWSSAIVIVWVFNLWGTADLLFAFYQGLFGARLDPRELGAAFFIPTVVVPALLITHALIFRLLVRVKH